MKTYKSHKVVEAAKITGLRAGDGGLLLCFRASPQVEVDGAWLTKHAPEQDPWKLIGGYFVRYPDGYTSWSPAGAFEEGYTKHSLDPKDGALPVSGYRPQTPATVTFVNSLKEQEERALRLLDQLSVVGAPVIVDVPDLPAPDLRFVAIARTHIQEGFMAAARAVFQPGRVRLPEDDKSATLGQAESLSPG